MTLNGVAPPTLGEDSRRAEEWLADTKARCADHAYEFVTTRCRESLRGLPEGQLATATLPEFVAGGKFFRSAFAYVGWSCGGASGNPRSESALRAVASLELLHCFALVQDDVMDASDLRRGRPTLHRQLAEWHRKENLAGSADKFGDSAATLFGDLFLVWAEQMLRESGMRAEALLRTWPRYDAMRAELAVGQLSDLVNDARSEPSWDSVLDVARRKSGHYTVRRPLEFGASLAGCDGHILALLGHYGTLIGEAFQLRDDVLGVFGDPMAMGKPVGEDLRHRTASTLVVLARDRADAAQRRTLRALAHLDVIDDDAVAVWQEIIEGTGARTGVENMITTRVATALDALPGSSIPATPREVLTALAHRCTARSG